MRVRMDDGDGGRLLGARESRWAECMIHAG
jgi:hypothetical protein